MKGTEVWVRGGPHVIDGSWQFWQWKVQFTSIFASYPSIGTVAYAGYNVELDNSLGSFR